MAQNPLSEDQIPFRGIVNGPHKGFPERVRGNPGLVYTAGPTEALQQPVGLPAINRPVFAFAGQEEAFLRQWYPAQGAQIVPNRSPSPPV